MVLTTIRLSRPGLSPPVYLAGTFTQWEPTIEMDHDAVFGSRDQHEFSKAVDIEAGEHQFKFRLGHGDWWIVDESTPTVTDDSGNVNNVIQVFENTEPETKVCEVNEQSLPVKEDKPAPPVKEAKPVLPVKEDKSTRSIEEDKPAPPAKDDKPTPPIREEKPALPVKEKKPAQKVSSKETFSSVTTTASQLTAVVKQETSSVQSISTESNNDKETPSKQEPQTQNQKREADAVPNHRVPESEKEHKPVQASSESFFKRLFSCFSGKTVFGMAAVSAVLVAVYVRR